ncbi:MAG TPA: hypothetical protein VJB70_03405 [Candidatus Paceibacterota bacterium]
MMSLLFQIIVIAAVVAAVVAWNRGTKHISVGLFLGLFLIGLLLFVFG